MPAELVDQARVDARSVGYAQGWSQGLREAAVLRAGEQVVAQADHHERAQAHVRNLESALRSVRAAGERLDETVVQITDEIADRILAAAVELAEALLGVELRNPVTSAAAVLSRVLAVAPEKDPITVWLSPQDYETLTGDGATALIAAVGASAANRLNFECDPTLAVGDATARSAATSIDARLTEALTRLRAYTAAERAGHE